MATLGVFLGLGGTAWAVAANSVGTAQLKDQAVTTPKLADASVGYFKLKDRAVGAAKLGDGAVTGAKVADGSLTGADINKSQLGSVPQAVNADTLGGSDGTSWVLGEPGSNTLVLTDEQIMHTGDPGKMLGYFDQLHLTGQCLDASGQPNAEFLLVGPAGTRGDSGEGQVRTVFPSDGASHQTAILTYTATSASDKNYFSYNVSASSPDGTHLDGVIHVGVHPVGGDCVVGGFVVVNHSR
jgi:hypothetical protein